MNTSIQLEDLSVRFGPVVALDDATVSFARGTATALVGPNGSGKTTMLNVIAGLVPIAGGSIDLAEHQVAFVQQRPHHDTWIPLTVREVITMGMYGEAGLLGRISGDRRRRVVAAAARIRVDDLLASRFSQLSGGQQQRVLIAQALVQEPTVLLMDEPITGLDLTSQQMILDLIDAERTDGTTVVMSTHHLDEARHCDVVVLLSSHVVAVGSPDDVLTPERLRMAYGGRFLGDHQGHGHGELLILDDHGHGTDTH